VIRWPIHTHEYKLEFRFSVKERGTEEERALIDGPHFERFILDAQQHSTRTPHRCSPMPVEEFTIDKSPKLLVCKILANCFLEEYNVQLLFSDKVP
jgi:hypothetical protein